MTLSLSESAQEIERVMDLPFHPVTDAGKAELIRALYQTARTPQHARATMDELVRGERCPTPKEIIDTAWALLPEHEKRARGCRFGCIEGWRMVRLRNGYEGVQRCACQKKQTEDAKVAAAHDEEW